MVMKCVMEGKLKARRLEDVRNIQQQDRRKSFSPCNQNRPIA